MAEVNTRNAMKGAYTVTPADTDLTQPFERLWIGVTGNVTIRTFDNQNVQFTNVPVGWFNVAGKQVRVATTATGIVAVY